MWCTANGGPSLQPWCPRFLMGSVTEAWNTHVTVFNCPSTPGDQKGTACPTAPDEHKQTFTINHTVSKDYLTWPKAPNIQRHSQQAGYSKIIPQEPVKGWSLGICMVWIMECKSHQVVSPHKVLQRGSVLLAEHLRPCVLWLLSILPVLSLLSNTTKLL